MKFLVQNDKAELMRLEEEIEHWKKKYFMNMKDSQNKHLQLQKQYEIK